MSRTLRKANALVLGMLLTASLAGCVVDESDEWLVRIQDRGTAGALAVPGSINAEVGDEVRWSNTGARVHEITGGLTSGDLSRAEDAEIIWGPERLGPGETLSHFFEDAGVYLFWFEDETTFATIVVEPK